MSHVVSVSNTKLCCCSVQKPKEWDGCVPIKFNSNYKEFKFFIIVACHKIALFFPSQVIQQAAGQIGTTSYSLPPLIFSNEVTLKAEEYKQVCFGYP